MRISCSSENGLLKRRMNDSHKWLPTRTSLNQRPSIAFAPRPVPISMKLFGDSICPLGMRKIPPMDVRKFNPLGDILASVFPPKESNTENLPPISISPKWDLPTDWSGSAIMPKAESERMSGASRTDRRLRDAKGPLVVMGFAAPENCVQRALK